MKFLFIFSIYSIDPLMVPECESTLIEKRKLDIPIECQYKIKTGNARGFLTTYFYNPQSSKCEEGHYGGGLQGCAPFDEMEECIKTCEKK